MASALQVFQFEGAETLRSGLTDDGVPYVIAADVCKVAGQTNVSKALERLDDDEKGITSTDTLGGKQRLAYVTESGFFALVLSFRLRQGHPNYEKLKRFRKWVTSEVLPAIRKTGRYEAPAPEPLPAPTGTELMLRQMKATVALLERQTELERCQADQERRLAALESGASTALAVASSAESKADAALAASSADSGYVSLLGFCRLHNLQLSVAEMAAAGGQLTRACRAAGVPIKTAPHQVFGRINLYRLEVLREWMEHVMAAG